MTPSWRTTVPSLICSRAREWRNRALPPLALQSARAAVREKRPPYSWCEVAAVSAKSNGPRSTRRSRSSFHRPMMSPPTWGMSTHAASRVTWAPALELGHHHAGELVEVMGVVDEEDDSPPLGFVVEQLGQSAQHHQRVLKVGGVEVVEQDAQGPVGKLGGNGAAPDLDYQVLVAELLKGALGDKGLAGPVVAHEYDAAAGTRRQGLNDVGNDLLAGEGSVLTAAITVSLRRKH